DLARAGLRLWPRRLVRAERPRADGEGEVFLHRRRHPDHALRRRERRGGGVPPGDRARPRGRGLSARRRSARDPRRLHAARGPGDGRAGPGRSPRGGSDPGDRRLGGRSELVLPEGGFRQGSRAARLGASVPYHRRGRAGRGARVQTGTGRGTLRRAIVLRFSRQIVFAAALLIAAALPISCSRSQNADRWWNHVKWLADDAREGRGTGTRGYRAAADYVAREFRTAGAVPAGTSGFFQPIRFIGRRIRESECLLALVHDGRADTLELGQDANFSTTCDPPDSLEADAVFVGFGLQIPEYGHDDL